jgi:hypothetical protein
MVQLLNLLHRYMVIQPLSLDTVAAVYPGRKYLFGALDECCQITCCTCMYVRVVCGAFAPVHMHADVDVLAYGLLPQHDSA